MLIGIVLALWLAYGYRGAYFSLSEWQLDRFGFYLPSSTQALIALVVGLPIVAVLIVRGRRARDEQRLVAAVRVASRFRSILAYTAGLFAIAAAVTLIVMFAALPADGPARPVDVGGRDAFRNVWDRPVVLRGGTVAPPVVLYRQRYLIGERLTGFAQLRIDDSAVDASTPVVFVELLRGADGRYRLPSRRGVILRGGLPGAVRTLYERLGVVVPREHLVLYQQVAAPRLAYIQMAAQFACVALIFAVAAGLQTRRVRRLRRADVTLAPV